MSSNAAIIARLGLDPSEFKQGLRSAQATFEQAKQAMKAADKKSGTLFRGEDKIREGPMALAQGLATATSAGEALADTAGFVAKSLNLPAGVAASIGAVAVAYSALQAEVLKAEATIKAVNTLLSTPVSTVAGKGTDSLRADLQQIDALQKRILEDTRGPGAGGFAAFMGSMKNNLTLGATRKAFEDGLKAENELFQRRVEVLKEIADVTRGETAKRGEVEDSERVTALLEARLAAEKQIDALNQRADAQGPARAAFEEKITAEHVKAVAAIHASFDAKDRERELEKDLLRIKREGVDVEVRSAARRAIAARAELDATSTNEAREGAKVKVTAAEDELAAARETSRQTAAKLALEKQIADMIAPKDAKERARLLGEIANLQKELENAKGDARDRIDTELSKARDKQRDLNKADADKAKQLRDLQIEGGAGRGEAEQLRILNEKIVARTKDLAVMRQIKGATIEQQIEEAKLRGELNAIANQRAAIAEKVRDSITEARGNTAIMQLEKEGHKDVAELLKTILSYEQQILQAKRDKNTELAEELTKQMALETQKAGEATRDKAKFTAEELRGSDHGPTRRRADRIADFEAEADQEAMRGNTKRAATLQDRANDLRDRFIGRKRDGRNENPFTKEETDKAKENKFRDAMDPEKAQRRAEGIKKGLDPGKDSKGDLEAAVKNGLDNSQVLKSIDKSAANLGKML